jgi:hypothetical protein
MADLHVTGVAWTKPILAKYEANQNERPETDLNQDSSHDPRPIQIYSGQSQCPYSVAPVAMPLTGIPSEPATRCLELGVIVT